MIYQEEFYRDLDPSLRAAVSEINENINYQLRDGSYISGAAQGKLIEILSKYIGDTRIEIKVG